VVFSHGGILFSDEDMIDYCFSSAGFAEARSTDAVQAECKAKGLQSTGRAGIVNGSSNWEFPICLTP